MTDKRWTLAGTYDPDAGWDFGYRPTPKWSDLFGIAPHYTASDEVMGIGELVEGMRLRMPSGQVFTVTDIHEPDADGVVRFTAEPEA